MGPACDELHQSLSQQPERGRITKEQAAQSSSTAAEKDTQSSRACRLGEVTAVLQVEGPTIQARKLQESEASADWTSGTD